MCKTDLISSLVSKFDQKLGYDVHENAAQALADIVAISVTSASSPLIAQLESEDMVKTLFGYILSEVISISDSNLKNRSTQFRIYLALFESLKSNSIFRITRIRIRFSDS